MEGNNGPLALALAALGENVDDALFFWSPKRSVSLFRLSFFDLLIARLRFGFFGGSLFSGFLSLIVHYFQDFSLWSLNYYVQVCVL